MTIGNLWIPSFYLSSDTLMFWKLHHGRASAHGRGRQSHASMQCECEGVLRESGRREISRRKLA